MATQVVIDIKEYEELQMYKQDYQKIIDNQIKFSEETKKRLETEYDQKKRNIDFWIEQLDSKKWRVMFAGYSKSQTSIWPTEFTRTKVWQIVPKEDITGWLKFKTWIN